MMKCEPFDWGLDCEWKELEVLVARALHRCLIFSTLGLLSIFFISSVFFFHLNVFILRGGNKIEG